MKRGCPLPNDTKDVDWLEGDIDAVKAKQRDQALEVAETYLVFADTPRAIRLLELWEENLVNKQTPVDSSVQRYAADEAVRDFVRGIRRQIKMVQELKG